MNKTITEMVKVPLVDEPMLDFTSFLRVLRWMLDSNFANINGAAEKAADAKKAAAPVEASASRWKIVAKAARMRRGSV